MGPAIGHNAALVVVLVQFYGPEWQAKGAAHHAYPAGRIGSKGRSCDTFGAQLSKDPAGERRNEYHDYLSAAVGWETTTKRAGIPTRGGVAEA